MSDFGAGAAEFTDLWKSVSKGIDSKRKKAEKRMAGTTTSPLPNGFQSPKGTKCRRMPGFNYGDSPGDVEPSQDIFWDSTSPTSANTGFRNTRVVEISDIVNRIAPKDMKQKGTESALLQWMGDSDVSCTPDIPKVRVRKKSTRQSNVADLVKLARQFDENMQQDRESSEHLNTVNKKLDEFGNTSKTDLRETSSLNNSNDLQCLSSSDPVEAELHALFDCSTQAVSGQLSQLFSASACSQEVKEQAVTGVLKESGQTKQKSMDKSDPAAHSAEKRGACDFSTNNCDDFDDDWENDDLLNDSFVLAMTQNPPQQLDINPKTTLHSNTKKSITHIPSACQSTPNALPALRPLDSKPGCCTLQELWPKLKTSNRSTFKLETNPHFQAKNPFKSNFGVKQPNPQMSEIKPASTKMLSTSQSDKITNCQTEICGAAESIKGISDSLWDDGDDDALLYEICDSVERISNSRPQQVSPDNKKQAVTVDRWHKSSKPLLIERVRPLSSKANRESPCQFVRSNSLPGTRSEAVNYQGWNIPMKGAINHAHISQSLPESHSVLGTFSQFKDSSGIFRPGKHNVDIKQYTVAANAPSKSCHTAFKRNVSDSAVISSKVFVTSQMTGRCSAAEIERKKQEALARRRQRLQNTPKP